MYSFILNVPQSLVLNDTKETWNCRTNCLQLISKIQMNAVRSGTLLLHAHNAQNLLKCFWVFGPYHIFFETARIFWVLTVYCPSHNIIRVLWALTSSSASNTISINIISIVFFSKSQPLTFVNCHNAQLGHYHQRRHIIIRPPTTLKNRCCS